MIRRALPADAKAIAQVHISSWQDAYRDLMPSQFLSGLQATLTRREAHWVRSLALGASTVWVAEVGQQVVGWIAVGASRDEDAVQANVGEVMAVYVLAEHWYTGVGLALWKAGLQDLLAQGYERLTLWVLAGNERAIRFYRRAGVWRRPGLSAILKGAVLRWWR